MTLLIICLAVAAIAVTIFLIKKGKIEDKNGNNIPDALENKVKQVVTEVKETATKVKKTTKKKATKE